MITDTTSAVSFASCVPHQSSALCVSECSVVSASSTLFSTYQLGHSSVMYESAPPTAFSMVTKARLRSDGYGKYVSSLTSSEAIRLPFYSVKLDAQINCRLRSHKLSATLIEIWPFCKLWPASPGIHHPKAQCHMTIEWIVMFTGFKGPPRNKVATTNRFL
jgi:hypothetical protein